MDVLSNLASTFLARFVGIAVAGIAGFLMTHYGFSVDTATQQELATKIVGLITVMLAAYVAGHRTTSKITNPGDAASSHLAAKESSEATILKANAP